MVRRAVAMVNPSRLSSEGLSESGDRRISHKWDAEASPCPNNPQSRKTTLLSQPACGVPPDPRRCLEAQRLIEELGEELHALQDHDRSHDEPLDGTPEPLANPLGGRRPSSTLTASLRVLFARQLLSVHPLFRAPEPTTWLLGPHSNHGAGTA